MSTALGVSGAFVLSLVVLIARSLLTDEIKGRVQQRTRAHLDATLDALPAEVRACWEEEWRAELAAKLEMPVTAWQLVCGIRRTAAELVAEPATAAAVQSHPTPQRRGLLIKPTPQRAAAALHERRRVLVLRIVRVIRVVFGGVVVGIVRAIGDIVRVVGGIVRVVGGPVVVVVSVFVLVVRGVGGGIGFSVSDVVLVVVSVVSVVVGVVSAIDRLKRRRL